LQWRGREWVCAAHQRTECRVWKGEKIWGLFRFLQIFDTKSINIIGLALISLVVITEMGDEEEVRI
jgi:hypothetical protein